MYPSVCNLDSVSEFWSCLRVVSLLTSSSSEWQQLRQKAVAFVGRQRPNRQPSRSLRIRQVALWQAVRSFWQQFVRGKVTFLLPKRGQFAGESFGKETWLRSSNLRQATSQKNDCLSLTSLGLLLLICWGSRKFWANLACSCCFDFDAEKSEESGSSVGIVITCSWKISAVIRESNPEIADLIRVT